MSNGLVPAGRIVFISEARFPSLRDHIEAINRRRRRNALDVAAGPADLNLIELRRLPETEVWPLIRAGSKTSSGQHVTRCVKSIRRNKNRGPHSVPRTPTLCAPRSGRSRHLERNP
jgi:hypothetical protein